MEKAKIKELTDSPAIDIALDTISINKQALVFCNTRASSEAAAEKIAQEVKLESPELKAISEEILKALQTPTKQCRRLAFCVKNGTAFHHAGLASAQRKLVEDGFRKGVIKIICSTPTLCISENTKIWYGMEEIEAQKFRSRNSLFVLSNTKIVSMKAQKIEKNFNEHELVKITSVSGYSITLTLNHKILVKRNNKKETILAAECKKSDKIATIGRINLSKDYKPHFKDFVIKNAIPFENTALSEDYFYLIGAMLGDGYSGAEKKNGKIIYKGSPTIVGEDKEIFDSIIATLKSDNLHSNLTKNYYGTPSLILTKANWFREFLCNCGVEKGIGKHIDLKLMNGSKEKIKALLQGLYDTDGYVQSGIKAVGFANTSHNLIKNTQKLLLRFGIVTIIREKQPSTMKIYNKEYATKKSYELFILNKKCLKIFEEEINFRVTRKREALHNITKEIESNINYVECKKCNYKIYHDLFSGRTREQKIWGSKKFKIINTLGRFGELKSKELTTKLGFLPRHPKGNRLNHHYSFISKKKFGNREWVWSLNPIGKYIFAYIFKQKKTFGSFFINHKTCPVCEKIFETIVKKGWRDSDFDGDIYWDKIKKIEIISKKESQFVYDVVLGNNRKNEHFFVADSILVHNSFGLNLPAFRSIIKDLKRYGGKWGMEYIPALEYHQMAGRAGRPDFNDKFGEAICIAQTEKDAENILEKFINAPPEKIQSKMAAEPALRTYCLSLISTGFARSKKELMEFFEKTFYAKQYGDLARIKIIIDRILRYLEEWEFITVSESSNFDGFVSASRLSDVSLEATKLGERVAELYLDPYTAYHIIMALKRGLEKTTSEISFLQLASSTLELRPLPTVKVKEAESMEGALQDILHSLITPECSFYDPDYEEYLKSIKLTIALNDWMDEKNEEDILESYNIAPGELHFKKELVDWILYAAEELAKIFAYNDLIKLIRKTRFRLDKGIKEELVPLARIKNIGRVRARLLFRNGIKDIGDIKSCDLMNLIQLLGKQTALKLKEDVGEAADYPVSTGKRKGQMSVEKYE